LPTAPELGDLSGEQSPPSGAQVALTPDLVAEERQGQRAPGAVADRHLQQVATALPHRAYRGALHLGQHGGLLADVERTDVGVLTALVVPAGDVVDQVTRGVQVEVGGERLGRLRPDQLAERSVDGGLVGAHSTPTSSG